MFLQQMWFLGGVLKNRYSPGSKLRRFQLKRLKRILKHAYKNVDYYKKEVHVHKLSDLKKLPIITRDEIMSNYADFISKPYKTSIGNRIFKKISATSGSTGSSFKILKNERCSDFQEAIYLRGLLAIGFSVFDLTTHYWYKTYPKKFFNHFGLMNRTTVLSSEPCLKKQIQQIVKANPDVLFYFPAVLLFLSREMTPQQIKSLTKLRIIIVHAEIFTESMRTELEQKFRVPVYNMYGTTEFNRMGWECKHKRIHLDVDNTLFEFDPFPEAQDPDLRRVIVTDLHNTTFPLIRYQLGDIVRISKNQRCKCGSHLPIIESVEGREKDFIIGYKKALSPIPFIDSLVRIKSVKRFQIVQKKPDELIVNIVSASNNARIDVKQAISKISPIITEVNFVENIPITPRGKTKLIDSLLNKDRELYY